MKNFIDFIVDATEDKMLGEEFSKHAEKSDHGRLSQWFKEKGYHVDEAHCKTIKDNKNDLRNTNLGYTY